jgi:hypothetical protein
MTTNDILVELAKYIDIGDNTISTAVKNITAAVNQARTGNLDDDDIKEIINDGIQSVTLINDMTVEDAKNRLVSLFQNLLSLLSLKKL